MEIEFIQQREKERKRGGGVIGAQVLHSWNPSFVWFYTTWSAGVFVVQLHFNSFTWLYTCTYKLTSLQFHQICLILSLFGVEKTIALGHIHNHRNQRCFFIQGLQGPLASKSFFVSGNHRMVSRGSFSLTIALLLRPARKKHACKIPKHLESFPSTFGWHLESIIIAPRNMRDIVPP